MQSRYGPSNYRFGDCSVIKPSRDSDFFVIEEVAFENSKAVLGTIAAIYRYPVKSMAGEALAAATIGERGVQGDRAYAIFDALERRVASAKQVAKFPGLLEFSSRFVGDD